MITKGVVLVCVGLDAETAALVHAAVSLARRAQMQLRLVHVVEYLFEPWLADMPLYQYSGAVLYEAQEDIRRGKQKLLDDLLASLPTDVRGTAELLAGDAVAAIASDAAKCRANLVMASYNLDKHAAQESGGYGFALRLMANAPLPVLVMNRQQPVDFGRDSFAMLFGDDLQPASDEAARKVFELAGFMAQQGARVRVRQLHVHGDFREVLRDRWFELQSRYPELLGSAKSPEELLLSEYNERKSRLSARGGRFRQQAEAAGASVEVDVASGSVHDSFDNAIRDVDPDLVVFGRHRTLKIKPYLIGRVGLRVMLRLGRPVLVVPPFEQIELSLPFPAAD